MCLFNPSLSYQPTVLGSIKSLSTKALLVIGDVSSHPSAEELYNQGGVEFVPSCQFYQLYNGSRVLYNLKEDTNIIFLKRLSFTKHKWTAI